MLNGLVAREIGKHTEAAGKACKEFIVGHLFIPLAILLKKYFYFFSEARGPNFMRALFFISFFYASQRKQNKKSHRKQQPTHLRQIILSWLYLRARICSDGSMIPPRRRRTRCSVDSFWML